MEFVSLFSPGSSFALAESILIIQLRTLLGYHGVFHTLWPKTTWGRAGLCDNYRKRSPTSGAASARSSELECHCSRVIMRAKCTITSCNCDICKGEQSVNDFTAAFLQEPFSKGHKETKAKEILFPWLLIYFLLQSHCIKSSDQIVPTECSSPLGTESAPSSLLLYHPVNLLIPFCTMAQSLQCQQLWMQTCVKTTWTRHL